jgi:hypothetical protein
MKENSVTDIFLYLKEKTIIFTAYQTMKQIYRSLKNKEFKRI